MTDTPRIRDALPDLHAQYQRLLQRLEANEHQFRRLARSVWRVQEDERRRLARWQRSAIAMRDGGYLALLAGG